MTDTSMSVHVTFYIAKRVQRNASIQVNRLQKKSFFDFGEKKRKKMFLRLTLNIEENVREPCNVII